MKAGAKDEKGANGEESTKAGVKLEMVRMV